MATSGISGISSWSRAHIAPYINRSVLLTGLKVGLPAAAAGYAGYQAFEHAPLMLYAGTTAVAWGTKMVMSMYDLPQYDGKPIQRFSRITRSIISNLILPLGIGSILGHETGMLLNLYPQLESAYLSSVKPGLFAVGSGLALTSLPFFIAKGIIRFIRKDSTPGFSISNNLGRWGSLLISLGLLSLGFSVASFLSIGHNHQVNNAVRMQHEIIFSPGNDTRGMLPSHTNSPRIIMDSEIAEIKAGLGNRLLAHEGRRDAQLLLSLRTAQDFIAIGDMENAIKWGKRITEFPYSGSTELPNFYHEATFIIADAQKNIGQTNMDKEDFLSAVQSLQHGLERLKGLETGYKSKYCMEILSIAALHRQLFGSDILASDTQPGSYQYYLDGATALFNSHEGGFDDNFIALRSMLSFAEYSTCSNDFESALNKYNTVIALVKLFSGKELTEEENQLAGKYVNMSRYRIEVSIREVLERDQFDASLLQIFEARAYVGKARLHMQQSATLNGTEKVEQISLAVNLYKDALSIMTLIKASSNSDFYRTSKWEERQLYFMILAETAESMTAVYRATGDNTLRTLALKYSEEIRSYYETTHDEIVKGPYLKAKNLGI
ncbi:MAG: hypothetical protein WC490_05070 [Candidatus Margulisiibacteriota bacterium]